MTPQEDGDDLWTVHDALTGAALGRVSLGCASVGSTTLPHAEGPCLSVDLAGGDGGGWIGTGRWEDGRPIVDVRASPYGVLADVHPDGHGHLTVPMEDGRLTVCHLPDGAPEAVQEGDFDLCGGYLDADRVIAKEFDGPTALFTSDSLEPICTVSYPPGAVTDLPLPNGRGTWTTYARGRLQSWRTA
ncbi:hypothetical protein [Spirillospora sp. NPDC029432]|uniref:hypothetical protein n=1 Tax=Spirillospora sp. NPDC029432 TaxID=3154599 RepID=UPI003456F151